METKKLSRFITNDEFINETEVVYNTLEKDELFNDDVNHNCLAGMPIDQARKYSIKRLKRLYEYDFHQNYFSFHYALTAVQVDNDTRRGINFGVCLFLFVLKKFFSPFLFPFFIFFCSSIHSNFYIMYNI